MNTPAYFAIDNLVLGTQSVPEPGGHDDDGDRAVGPRRPRRLEAATDGIRRGLNVPGPSRRPGGWTIPPVTRAGEFADHGDRSRGPRWPRLEEATSSRPGGLPSSGRSRTNARDGRDNARAARPGPPGTPNAGPFFTEWSSTALRRGATSARSIERDSGLSRDVAQVLHDGRDEGDPDTRRMASASRSGSPGIRGPGRPRRRAGVAEDADPFVDLALELVRVDEAVDPQRPEKVADPAADAPRRGSPAAGRTGARTGPSWPRSGRRRGYRPSRPGSSPCGRRARGPRPAAARPRPRSCRADHSCRRRRRRSPSHPGSAARLRIAISIFP